MAAREPDCWHCSGEACAVCMGRHGHVCEHDSEERHGPGGLARCPWILAELDKERRASWSPMFSIVFNAPPVPDYVKGWIVVALDMSGGRHVVAQVHRRNGRLESQDGFPVSQSSIVGWAVFDEESITRLAHRRAMSPPEQRCEIHGPYFYDGPCARPEHARDRELEAIQRAGRERAQAAGFVPVEQIRSTACATCGASTRSEAWVRCTAEGANCGSRLR